MVFCSTIVCFTSKVMCLQMMRGVLQCFLFGAYLCSVWYYHLVYILFLMRVGFRLCPSVSLILGKNATRSIDQHNLHRNHETMLCFGTYKHKDQIKQLFSLCVNCQATPFGSTQVGDRQIVRKHVIFCKRCT